MFEEIQRILILVGQDRHQLAESEARKLIAAHPEEADGYTMLAFCLAASEKDNTQATELAVKGISMDPDSDFAHYVHSICLHNRNRHKEALKAIDQAIDLDPYDENYFGHKSLIFVSMGKWKEALEAAEAGLEIDPEDEDCFNLRSISLERLGRGNDAMESAKQNLQNSPNSSYSHASLGWTQLNNSRYQEAQESFRESLRLDPNNDLAREGMISSLQGNSFLYRLIHRYEVFMSRLGTKYQFAIVIGLWLAVRFSTQVAKGFGEWSVFIVPLVLLVYLTFAVLTWTSDAIHNSLLRFHPMGRHLLKPDQIIQSNLVIACFACAGFGLFYGTLAAGFISGIGIGMYWILMTVVPTEVYSMDSAKKKWITAISGTAIGLFPPTVIAYKWITGNNDSLNSTFIYFCYAILGYQLISTFIVDREEVE